MNESMSAWNYWNECCAGKHVLSCSYAVHFKVQSGVSLPPIRSVRAHSVNVCMQWNAWHDTPRPERFSDRAQAAQAHQDGQEGVVAERGGARPAVDRGGRWPFGQRAKWSCRLRGGACWCILVERECQR